MKLIALTFLMIALLSSSVIAHAEGGCPPGMIPYSGTDMNSCGPMPPGYYKNQNQQQAPPARWASQWGAISIDVQTESAGVSANAGNEQEAKDQALFNCERGGGKNCKIEITYHDQCAAWSVATQAITRRLLPQKVKPLRLA